MCVVCFKDQKQEICKDCMEKAKTHFLVHCINCDTKTWIKFGDKLQQKIERILHYPIPHDPSEGVSIVPSNRCPNCPKEFPIKMPSALFGNA